MKQKYDIHSLSVVPYIIAERAAWNVLEESYKELTIEQCCKVVEAISQKLVERSEVVYSNNEPFRKGLNSKKNDPRYYLEMFMEHWTKSLLGRGKIKQLLN